MLFWERLLRRLPSRRWFFTQSLIAMVIGLMVVLLMGLGRPEVYEVALFFSGAVVGLFINAGAILTQALFYTLVPTLRDRSKGVKLVANNLAFFFGGGAGFLTGNRVASLLGAKGFRIEDGTTFVVVIFGLLAIGVGLVFNLVGTLRERLAESVARVKEQEFAQRQLQLARSLQRRLLAPESVTGDGYRIESRNLAALTVAGDFYDVFPLGDGDLGLVVADVAGKGIPAALIVASVKALTPLIAAERSVSETLEELNRRLARDLDRREFVALAFARYSPQSGRLEIGNAGMPDPYRLTKRGVEPLQVPGPRLPLGARDRVAYESLETELSTGDSLLMLSDGIPEAILPDGSPLGYEWLLERLESMTPTGDPAARLDGLLQGLTVEVGERPEDDWTLLLLERGSRAASKGSSRESSVASPPGKAKKRKPERAPAGGRRRRGRSKKGAKPRKRPSKTP